MVGLAREWVLHYIWGDVGLIWYSHKYTISMKVASLGVSKLFTNSIALLKHVLVLPAIPLSPYLCVILWAQEDKGEERRQ